MRRIKYLLAIISACILISCNDDTGQQERTVVKQPLMVVEKVDADFIATVNDIVNAEIAAGKLAMAKGSDKRIKNFGRIMVKDYTKGLEKLTKLAAAKRIPLTYTSATATSAKISALNSMTGKDFDRAYIDYITADHKSAITIFEAAHKNCFDKDIKSIARKGILVFKRHLEAIFAIRDSMR
jgi:putative membrane protein